MNSETKKTEKLIYLPSVGTYLDPLTANTFASFKDGTPDLENAVNLNQISDEWIASLSRQDYIKIIEI